MRERTWISRLPAWAQDGVRAAAPAVAIILVGGTFMAVLSPFDTDALTWPAAWVYWVAMMAVGAGGGTLATRWTGRWAAYWPLWLQWLVIAAAAAVPVSAVVLLLNGVAVGRGPALVWWPLTYFYVFVVSGAVTGVMFLVSLVQERDRAAEHARERASGAPSRAPFFDRLPAKLKGATLYALQSEDHYVRVHTSAGDDLILLRLADAEKELEPHNGLRVHRSWWVARDAVASVARGDGRMTLTLVNGVDAPVSRTYARRVREAGWA